jgi:hypothetical protein
MQLPIGSPADPQRRPLLRPGAEMLPFAPDDPVVRVLDLGGVRQYGI